MIFGPPHQAVTRMDQLNTSSATVWDLISGTEKDEIPATTFNVRILPSTSASLIDADVDFDL